EQAFALDDLDVLQRDCGSNWMAAVGQAMVEHGAVAHNRRGDSIVHDHCANRKITRCEALSGGDQVRPGIDPFASKPCSQPAPRTDDLIRAQENAVPVAEFAKPRPIARWGHARTAAVL